VLFNLSSSEQEYIVVTAKAAGRNVASVLIGAVASPFIAASLIPVAIGSSILANFPHASRFWRLHREIGEDLAQIDLIRRTPGHRHRAYYQRQLDKYLRPNEHFVDSWEKDLPKLLDFFVNAQYRENWSFSGMNSPCSHGLGCFVAFGYAPVNGQTQSCSSAIRIAPKAFHLPNSTLSGVMLHEATHFVLGTDDIAYDATFFPGHDDLKELARGEHYRNADNWRIFYQKMRKRFGR
jgi:hypothetical protein